MTSDARLPVHSPITATVEVFADVACPFAHVGLRRLLDYRHRIGRDDVRFRVLAWPLELINGQPLTGAAIAEKVAALREHVAPELFTRFRPDRFPTTTLPAMRLTSAAYARDGAIGEAVAWCVRDRVFEHGENVALPSVLASIAAHCGVSDLLDEIDPSPDPVETEWGLGRARGVIGSPHFFAHGHDSFCPTLSIAHPDGGLQIRLDQQRFEEFTQWCFTPSP